MAVAYDVHAGGTVSAVVTFTTPTFTIADVANRVALIAFVAVTDISADTISSSCSGVNGSQVQVPTKNRLFYNALQGVINPAAGNNKTATMTWETSAEIYGGVVVFNGAKQSDQFTGVQNSGSYTTSRSVSIASSNGDLTTSFARYGTEFSTDQTELSIGEDHRAKFDYGPGTGNTTHTWSRATSGNIDIAGCNIVQAVVGGGVVPADILLGMGVFNGGFLDG